MYLSSVSVKNHQMGLVVGGSLLSYEQCGVFATLISPALQPKRLRAFNVRPDAYVEVTTPQCKMIPCIAPILSQNMFLFKFYTAEISKKIYVEDIFYVGFIWGFFIKTGNYQGNIYIKNIKRDSLFKAAENCGFSCFVRVFCV